MMDQSYMSFDADPLQYRGKRTSKERSQTIHESQLALIQQKHKALYTAVQRVREANIVLKRDISMMAENIREEFRRGQKSKTDRIQSILQALDAKVLFVVESCDKYITRMNHELSKQANSKNKDEHQRQLVLNKCHELTERLHRLQQRAQIFKNSEQGLKRQLEAMHQRNIALTQQINVLTARSNEKLQQMDTHFKQKIQQFRRREAELLRREDVLKKQLQRIDHIQKSVSQPQLQVIKPPPIVSPVTTPPPTAPPAKNNSQFQPPANALQKINQNFKKPSTQQNRVVYYNPTPQESTITTPPQPKQRKPTKSNHNNAIQIKPDFFRNAVAQSQFSKISQMPQPRGIHIKSLNRDQLNGIQVKKLKQSTDQQQILTVDPKNRGKRSDSHRFDYLLNNLAATQQESTQIFNSQY